VAARPASRKAECFTACRHLLIEAPGEALAMSEKSTSPVAPEGAIDAGKELDDASRLAIRFAKVATFFFHRIQSSRDFDSELAAYAFREVLYFRDWMEGEVIEKVAWELTAARRSPYRSWLGKHYPNAHDAALDMVEFLFQEVRSTLPLSPDDLDLVRPDKDDYYSPLAPPTGRVIVRYDWQVGLLEQRFQRRKHEIQKKALLWGPPPDPKAQIWWENAHAKKNRLQLQSLDFLRGLTEGGTDRRALSVSAPPQINQNDSEKNGQQDKKQDRKKRDVPKNQLVLKLAREFKKAKGEKTRIEIAREIAEENGANAASLVRQLSRFPNLLE
jgi:hypothetical protein